MILLPFIVIKTNVNRDEQVSISNFSLSPFEGGSSLLFKCITKAKPIPNKFAGESDNCKRKEFCFGFHMNPTLIASLCMLVCQGTWYAVLRKTMCIYQVSTIFCSCRTALEVPYLTSSQICLFASV